MIIFLLQDFSKPTLGDEKPSHSIHKTSYEIDPDKPRPIPKTRADRKKQTDFATETHFNLGTWQSKTTSETNHTMSFVKEPYPHENSAREQKNDTSHVFCSGDWNQANRMIQAETIAMADFCYPSHGKQSNNHLTHEEIDFNQFIRPTYQCKTHFNSGNVTNENSSSIYSQDYLENSNCNMKLTSKVGPIHQLDLFASSRKKNFVSTSEYHFQNTDEEVISKMRAEGMKALEYNKMVDNLNSVPLSGNNRDSNFQAKYLSLTFSEFQEANLGCCGAGSVRFPEYNHLNAHYFTPDTKSSEVMSEYVQHENMSKYDHDVCSKRCHNNRSSHFILGTDMSSDPKSTTLLEFCQPVVMPSCKLRAAGKSLTLNNDHQHVLPTPEDNQGATDPMKTITRDHFKSPNDR